MAVSGRKVSTSLCEPCADDGYDIAADGCCKECAENMCSKCFQHHRKGRICRNHVFLYAEFRDQSSTGESDDVFDKCPKHNQENIKYYCPTHETLGCGDCIICEHKSCEVSYISDFTMGLDEKEYTDKVVKEIENCCNDIKEYESKIQRNIDTTHSVHKKFTHDVESFKQEILNKINRLTVDGCDQANGIKQESLCALQKLELELSDITEELSAMKVTAESDGEPRNNFISAIRLKKRLKEIEERFTEIDKMNKTEVYTFLKCNSIESAIDNCKGLDLIQRKLDVEQNQQDVKVYKDLRTVTLKKESRSLGFVLVGGHDGLPLSISRIQKGTPAEKSGKIRVSDEIISINNVDVTNKSQNEALKLIKESDETTFVLSRSPQDFRTTMQRSIQRNH